MRLLRPAGTALIAAAVLLSGCGDDSDGSGPFDAEGMSADIETLIDLTQTGVAGDFLFTASTAVFDEAIGGALVRGSAAAIRANRPVAIAAAELRERTAAAIAGSPIPAGHSAIIIPEELRGTTFEWDVDTDSYEESLDPGAPEDGVRFILYQPDPNTGLPDEPLQEIGEVDVIDGSTGTTDAARIIVRDGNTTFIDYAVTITEVTGGGTVTVDGFITDGDERLTFDLGTTVSGGALELDYELELEEREVRFDYTVDLGTDVAVDFQVSSPNGVLSFSGGGSEAIETYTFEANGEPFATYTIDSELNETFTGPDGEPLSAQEQLVVSNAYASTIYGFLLAQWLMSPIGVL